MSMKIFVAYGYNDRDRWVRELIFPIIEAFGGQVETGEELQGEIITEAVKEKIRRSDALIAFATRRTSSDPADRATHRWVTDELALAIAHNLPVVEVRERGVDQGGVAGNRQVITYDEKQRENCIVEVTKAIGKWCQGVAVTMQLHPEEFVDEVRPLLRRPGFRCEYTLLEGSRTIGRQVADVLPIKGGLFINVRGVPRQALVQVNVVGDGISWTSDFETTDSINIHLKRD
jgi:hypothetical protein